MEYSESETSWSQEKQKLIQKIIETKADHQQCILRLKNKSNEYDLLLAEKSNIEKVHSEEVNNISSQLNELKIEAAKLKDEYTKKNTENSILSHEIQMDLEKKSREYDLLLAEKSIIEKVHSETLHEMQTVTAKLKIQISKKDSENITLSHENQTLNARLKQLQTGGPQTTSVNEPVAMDPKNQPDTFELEEIIDHKKKRDGMHFLVRWKGYTPKDDTWEHESNLMCTLCEYKKKNNLK